MKVDVTSDRDTLYKKVENKLEDMEILLKGKYTNPTKNNDLILKKQLWVEYNYYYVLLQ